MSENKSAIQAQPIFVDYKCDGNCPKTTIVVPFFDTHNCCYGCPSSRKLYAELHPELKQYWTDKDGFWSEFGCRLPREKYPEECRVYDCRARIFYLRLAWAGNMGTQTSKFEILYKDDVEIKKMWDAMRDKVLEINGPTYGDEF